MSESTRGFDATDLLRRVISGADLERREMEELMGRLMDGELGREQQAALLAALATKGESADEIAGAAEAMRRRVVPLPHHRADVVDTCGTGGDGKGTFNVSTAAALIAAAAGVPVAKHGNRSVSSLSGSADVLAALGVEIDLDPERAAACLEQVGIAFLFAPRYHPAMREVVPVRKALGVRTIFNVLGPLTNPAGAKRQVVGVYADHLVETMARVLASLGSEHAMVVHGADGLDEITVTASTRVAEVRDGRVKVHALGPEAVGIERRRLREIRGGDPQANAERMVRVLEGERGALYDIATLNAAAAILVGGRASDLGGGLVMARRAVDSGAAREKLEALRAFGGGGAA